MNDQQSSDTVMLQPQPATIPPPEPGMFSQAYWDACNRRELTYQCCAECGYVNLLPARRCARCSHESMEWRSSAGRGSLYSWTVVWRPQRPEFVTPYAPAIVHLDEGYRMVGGIIGCQLDDLRAEMALQVEFHPTQGGQLIPYFRPA